MLRKVGVERYSVPPLAVGTQAGAIFMSYVQTTTNQSTNPPAALDGEHVYVVHEAYRRAVATLLSHHS